MTTTVSLHGCFHCSDLSHITPLFRTWHNFFHDTGVNYSEGLLQSLMRSTSTSEPVQLLRPTRNNRATVYAQLLYQWKLIDVGESLILRLTTIVDVVNISNGWINRTTIQNVLLLASDVRKWLNDELQRCCYLYTTKLTDSGESTYSIAYRIPFSNVGKVSEMTSRLKQ